MHDNHTTVLEKLGDQAVAQGNLAEAQRLFTEALAIAQSRADSDASNAEWQRELSVTLKKLAELAVAQGNLAEAQRLFAEGLRIAQVLAAAGKAEWERELSTAQFKVNDRVKIRYSRGMRGRIVELRGPLGPEGAQIYRIRLRGMVKPSYTEVREDQLVLIPPKT